MPLVLTPTIAFFTKSMFFCCSGMRKLSLGTVGVRSPVRAFSISLTRCGFITTPSFASVATACASCSGVYAL